MVTTSAGIGSLNVPDLLNLRSFFTDEENNTFEQIGVSYQRDFQRKDSLRVGIALLTMLHQHDLIPRPTQRLVALYLLYDMYAKEIKLLSQNPFAPVFLKLLSTPEVDSQQPPGSKKVESPLGHLPLITKQEKYFLVSLLGGGGRDLLKKTPKQVMSLELPSAPPADLTTLENAVKESQAHQPEVLAALLPVIVPIPDEQLAKDVQYSEQQATLKACEELLTGQCPPSVTSFRPEFIRLAPPLHVAEDEFIFLHPVDTSEYVPLFDKDMVAPKGRTTRTPAVPQPDRPQSSSGSRAEPESQHKEFAAENSSGEAEGEPVTVLQRALTSQLTLKEANWLVEQLNTFGSAIVEKVSMTPDKLPGLVEANPLVAVEVLLKLLSSKDLTSYFETLIHMDLSVQGLEVVNRLTTHVDLPEELLHVYVLNCIAACEAMQGNTLQQSRLVRLVCVFLQALIRNKVISVQALFIELQAFCISFSTIKEAAALFRMVQALSSGSGVDEATQ